MKPILHFIFVAFALTGADPCPGVCQPTSWGCTDSFVSGECPGGENIQCCPIGDTGQCQDTGVTCDGNFVAGKAHLTAGLCPGGDNIQCCQSGGPSSGNTYCDWAQALLQALGGSPTTQGSNSFMAMLGWMQGEGSPCQNNPLDTTQYGPSSSDCNSVGVKNFATMADGIKATISCMENGYYPDIIADLQNNADPLTTANTIANSPWGTHDAVSATQYCMSNFAACCNRVVPG